MGKDHFIYKSPILFAMTICLKGTNTQHSGHMVQNFQTELIVEIYFRSLVRAIGKVLCMQFN